MVKRNEKVRAVIPLKNKLRELVERNLRYIPSLRGVTGLYILVQNTANLSLYRRIFPLQQGAESLIVSQVVFAGASFLVDMFRTELTEKFSIVGEIFFPEAEISHHGKIAYLMKR